MHAHYCILRNNFSKDKTLPSGLPAKHTFFFIVFAAQTKTGQIKRGKWIGNYLSNFLQTNILAWAISVNDKKVYCTVLGSVVKSRRVKANPKLCSLCTTWLWRQLRCRTSGTFQGVCGVLAVTRTHWWAVMAFRIHVSFRSIRGATKNIRCKKVSSDTLR